MRPFWCVSLIVAVSATVRADCLPSGRDAFATGLEALHRGDLPTAAKVFYQLVQAQPTCAEARNNLAVVFTEQGRVEEAAIQLREAVQLKPDYQRARLNLTRVEALLKDGEARGGAAQVRNPSPASATTVAALAPETPPPSSEHTIATQPETSQRDGVRIGATSADGRPEGGRPTEPPLAGVGQAEARAFAAVSGAPQSAVEKPTGPSVPGNNPTPEPRGSTVCVIEAAHSRICVYQSTTAGMASDECYAIARTQVRSWPRWVVASEVTAKHIRLLDETGQTRLEIAVEDAAVSGDAVRLRQTDFESLAAKVVPWRTGWVMLE